MNKPREFWIYFRDNYDGISNTYVCDYNQRGFEPKEGDIHVIEVFSNEDIKKNALDALKECTKLNQEMGLE